MPDSQNKRRCIIAASIQPPVDEMVILSLSDPLAAENFDLFDKKLIFH